MAKQEVVKAKKVKTSKPKAEKPAASERFEDRSDIKKLVLYTIIVNYGQGDNILRILKNNKSSAQFVRVGEGTATRQVLDILNIEDNRKEIIHSIVSEEAVPEIKRELEAYFAISKRNTGIAYTMPLTTIVGVKMYKFFTQTVRG